MQEWFEALVNHLWLAIGLGVIWQAHVKLRALVMKQLFLEGAYKHFVSIWNNGGRYAM